VWIGLLWFEKYSSGSKQHLELQKRWRISWPDDLLPSFQGLLTSTRVNFISGLTLNVKHELTVGE
jgi:hypothetical protein